MNDTAALSNTTIAKLALGGLPQRLVQDGLLDEATMADALHAARERKMHFVTWVVSQNLAAARDVAIAASQEFGVPLLDLDAVNVDLEAVRRLDAQREEAARRGDDGDGGDHGSAYLALLLASTPDEATERALERFHWPRRLALQRERLRALLHGDAPPSDERLAALEPSSRRALTALDPASLDAVMAFEHAPDRPRVRGRDVVRLGLPPGPRVGAVLAQLERARTDGTVESFEEELELARALVERASAPEDDTRGRPG